MTGRAVLADPLANPCREIVVQRLAVAKHDEGRRVSSSTPGRCRWPRRLPGSDLAVDLRRADAHAGIRCRIGASKDDHAAAFREFHKIAVVPDVVVALEIRASVLGAVVIVQNRSASMERVSCTQLALLANDGLAVLVGNVVTMPLSLQDLALPDRRGRVAADETADDIRACNRRDERLS